jgi:prefoldin subunit 5
MAKTPPEPTTEQRVADLERVVLNLQSRLDKLTARVTRIEKAAEEGD